MSEVPTIPNVPSSVPFTSSPAAPSVPGNLGSSVPVHTVDARAFVQAALTSAASPVGPVARGT